MSAGFRDILSAQSVSSNEDTVVIYATAVSNSADGEVTVRFDDDFSDEAFNNNEYISAFDDELEDADFDSVADTGAGDDIGTDELIFDIGLDF